MYRILMRVFRCAVCAFPCISCVFVYTNVPKDPPRSQSNHDFVQVVTMTDEKDGEEDGLSLGL